MYKITNESAGARCGEFKTSHGKIKTPFYMPVVTKGAGKFLTFNSLENLNTQCFISNAYLLYLKPGLETIKKAGGYHNFINWQKPIFTDSGGFQLLDPQFLISLNDKGVKFRSPFSGEPHFVSPESLMNIQNTLSSDIAMVLDHVLGPDHTKKEFSEATTRTIAWARRCLDSHKNKNQKVFGIVQGGTYKDLRKECALAINDMGFDGLAIGGLAIGESKERMFQAIDYSLEYLDKDKIKYLMGVGSPEDMIISIGKGVDCFDSIYPTKMARHGMIFTRNGILKIGKSYNSHLFKPIEKDCDCYACKHHTTSYLHHLYRLDEPAAKILLSEHNVRFIHRLMEDARKAIEKGVFDKFQKEFLKNYLKSK
jgi:queuine tRNA-ribosyltransferase